MNSSNVIANSWQSFSNWSFPTLLQTALACLASLANSSLPAYPQSDRTTANSPPHSPAMNCYFWSWPPGVAGCYLFWHSTWNYDGASPLRGFDSSSWFLQNQEMTGLMLCRCWWCSLSLYRCAWRWIMSSNRFVLRLMVSLWWFVRCLCWMLGIVVIAFEDSGFGCSLGKSKRLNVCCGWRRKLCLGRLCLGLVVLVLQGYPLFWALQNPDGTSHPAHYQWAYCKYLDPFTNIRDDSSAIVHRY